ncbi:MAG: AtpZ/AtpI family protein [Candidatus Saccharibacteria bacterium]|nr:AtpZ/AtpI family protein [Candidatus Saccharibacteria bacterium]
MAEKPTLQSGSTTEVDTIRVMLGTIGDTTWRMFVPSVGLTLLGVWLDGQFGLKPWLMFAGIVLGFGAAVLLVRRQLHHIRQTKQKGVR